MNALRLAFLLLLIHLPLLADPVYLQFVPPPMEGKISMGIYNKEGRLVRTLHREADLTPFVVGIDGLLTSWDGKDDAGNLQPSGQYSARGFMVGPIEFEGESFHFNDWIEDENSPRIRKIEDLFTADNGLLLTAQRVDGARLLLRCDFEGKLLSSEPLPADFKAPAPAAHQGWTVAEGEVREYAPTGEFLRRLAITPGEPVPKKIVAGTGELIVLLEENDQLQRVRGLKQVGKEGGSSTWEITFEKEIVLSDTLEKIRGRLAIPLGDRVRCKLQPNPLLQEKRQSLDLMVAVETGGSVLKTGDGLPLDQISDTPGLLWAAIGIDPATKAIKIFQGDGAVVEEFTARKLDQMMSFDCGEFEFKAPPPPPPAPTSVPTPVPAPVLTPVPAASESPTPTPAPEPPPVG